MSDTKETSETTEEETTEEETADDLSTFSKAIGAYNDLIKILASDDFNLDNWLDWNKKNPLWATLLYFTGSVFTIQVLFGAYHALSAQKYKSQYQATKQQLDQASKLLKKVQTDLKREYAKEDYLTQDERIRKQQRFGISPLNESNSSQAIDELLKINF